MSEIGEGPARIESHRLLAARARSLIRTPAPNPDGATRSESGGGGPSPLGPTDIALIAARLRAEAGLSAEPATAYANQLVAEAAGAMHKLTEGSVGALTDYESSALEAVIHVRGRPALRVLGARLESFARYPGSEFWQDIVGDYEANVTAVAGATGALILRTPTGGLPPFTVGTAWLTSPTRLVTNRHVLRPEEGAALVETGRDGRLQLRSELRLAIEFAADDRTPPMTVRRNVTEILHVSESADPVDIAVLAIEPMNDVHALTLSPPATEVPTNLYVVGHPAVLNSVPFAVRAVFGSPDGRKRASFGKRMQAPSGGVFVHDASTIGGYSGGPVVGITGRHVVGLHYYGDPASGNLAVTAAAVRSHPSFGDTGMQR